MKQFVSLLLISLLGTALAYAQSSPAPQTSIVPDTAETSRKGDMARLAQKKSEEHFTTADEDKNGQLSRAEVVKHLPFFDANFARYDKNNDGFLSWEEFVGHDKWKQPSESK